MAASLKRGDQTFVRCRDCKNASAIYQWYDNPLVAQCSMTNSREVAETKRICKMFEQVVGEGVEVQHFDHY